MDLISRQAAIDAINKAFERVFAWDGTSPLGDKVLENVPSAQPEVRPIDYQDCSNAMLRMWMDNVVTDGEYNRIMDKLNEHEKKKGVLNEGQKNERYYQQTGGD